MKQGGGVLGDATPFAKTRGGRLAVQLQPNYGQGPGRAVEAEPGAALSDRVMGGLRAGGRYSFQF